MLHLLQALTPTYGDLWWIVPIVVAAITGLAALLAPVINSITNKSANYLNLLKEQNVLYTDLSKRVNIAEGKLTTIGGLQPKLIRALIENNNEEAQAIAQQIADVVFNDKPPDDPKRGAVPRRKRPATTKSLATESERVIP